MLWEFDWDLLGMSMAQCFGGGTRNSWEGAQLSTLGNGLGIFRVLLGLVLSGVSKLVGMCTAECFGS